MSLRSFIITCGAIVGLAAVVVVFESRKTSELRRQYATVVEEQGTFESRRLHSENLAKKQPTSQDQEALQRNLDHLQDLQSTRAVLRAQIEESIKRTLTRRAAPASSHPELMPWNKVGRATPAATDETEIWTIAQGDMET
jgi:hypothetical protein